MNKKKKLYIGKYLLLAGMLIMIAAGGLFWYLTQEKRDEARIIKTLQTLANDISKTSEENPAVTLLKIKSCADVCNFPVTVGFGKKHSREYDKETFISSLGRYRALLKELEVNISDIQVLLNDSGQARATFSGHYSAKSKLGTGHSDVNDITAVVVKIDGEWKIKELHFQKVLH